MNKNYLKSQDMVEVERGEAVGDVGDGSDSGAVVEEIFHQLTTITSGNKIIQQRFIPPPQIPSQDLVDLELQKSDRLGGDLEEIFHSDSVLLSNHKQLINYDVNVFSNGDDVIAPSDRNFEDGAGTNAKKRGTASPPSQDRSSGGGLAEPLYSHPMKVNKSYKQASFGSSFVVDSRGAVMTSKKQAGIRVLVPPNCVDGPMRVISRLVRWAKVEKAPQILYGEQLAAAMIAIDFGKMKLNKKVIVEVGHGVTMGKGQEMHVMLLTADATWKEAEPSATAPDDVQHVYRQFQNIDMDEKIFDHHMFRFVVAESASYAVLSRPRRDSFSVGSNGAHLVSNSNADVQVECPEGAIKKQISIGLQVLNEGLKEVGFSPMVTLHPRKRKFHKLVSISIPVDRQIQQPDIRLLCNLTGVPEDWIDVTGTSHITLVNSIATFATDVTATFWLAWGEAAPRILPKAKLVYVKLNETKNLLNLAVFARKRETDEARLRVLVAYVGENCADPSLERIQKFARVAGLRRIQMVGEEKMRFEVDGNAEMVGGDATTLVCKPLALSRVATMLSIRNPSQPLTARLIIKRDDAIGREDQLIEFELPNRRPDPTPAFAAQFSIVDSVASTFINENTVSGELRLIEMAENLGGKWKDFGRNSLQIPDELISKIESSYTSNEEKALVMLQSYLDSHTDDGDFLRDQYKSCLVDSNTRFELKAGDDGRVDDITRRKLSFIDRDVLSVIEEESLTPVDVCTRDAQTGDAQDAAMIYVPNIRKHSADVVRVAAENANEPIYLNVGDGLKLNGASNFDDFGIRFTGGQYTGTYDNVHDHISRDINIFEESICEANTRPTENIITDEIYDDIIYNSESGDDERVIFKLVDKNGNHEDDIIVNTTRNNEAFNGAEVYRDVIKDEDQAVRSYISDATSDSRSDGNRRKDDENAESADYVGEDEARSEYAFDEAFYTNTDDGKHETFGENAENLHSDCHNLIEPDVVRTHASTHTTNDYDDDASDDYSDQNIDNLYDNNQRIVDSSDNDGRNRRFNITGDNWGDHNFDKDKTKYLDQNTVDNNNFLVTNVVNIGHDNDNERNIDNIIDHHDNDQNMDFVIDRYDNDQSIDDIVDDNDNFQNIDNIVDNNGNYIDKKMENAYDNYTDSLTACIEDLVEQNNFHNRNAI